MDKIWELEATLAANGIHTPSWVLFKKIFYNLVHMMNETNKNLAVRAKWLVNCCSTVKQMDDEINCNQVISYHLPSEFTGKPDESMYVKHYLKVVINIQLVQLRCILMQKEAVSIIWSNSKLREIHNTPPPPPQAKNILLWIISSNTHLVGSALNH